ncbi:GntR family transcriptional regulator [Lichenifustis flavocetrariae]|uniref:GntR family transcriptional regulator n=1 Tax=Lichenifustis flavocetrariae TaxID=2949735 RepID=A0AA42CMU6_9HYPH|nr:GntR family transcriptional regulator [Lichenifustis flavocetrariae]MCW6508735.1 GntR family transcriptional regulator [Lichenifustis flavocetrariae]
MNAESPRDLALSDPPLSFGTTLNRGLPVAEQIYESLRDSIVTIRLLPGTVLSENRICRQFGVSRTPVRAAVLRLADEGLIDVYPQQGSVVSLIRLSRMEASRYVRRSLETSILLEAAAVWTPAMSLEMRDIIEAQRCAIETGALDLFYREDMRFHQTFCRLAGRIDVWATIAQAFAGLGRLVRLTYQPDRLPSVLAEHAAIIDALEIGDTRQAIHRLQFHLDQMFAVFGQLPDRLRRYVAE